MTSLLVMLLTALSVYIKFEILNLLYPKNFDKYNINIYHDNSKGTISI